MRLCIRSASVSCMRFTVEHRIDYYVYFNLNDSRRSRSDWFESIVSSFTSKSIFIIIVINGRIERACAKSIPREPSSDATVTHSLIHISIFQHNFYHLATCYYCYFCRRKSWLRLYNLFSFASDGIEYVQSEMPENERERREKRQANNKVESFLYLFLFKFSNCSL